MSPRLGKCLRAPAAGLTNELGPEHVRVQCALREYGRCEAAGWLRIAAAALLCPPCVEACLYALASASCTAQGGAAQHEDTSSRPATHPVQGCGIAAAQAAPAAAAGAQESWQGAARGGGRVQEGSAGFGGADAAAWPGACSQAGAAGAGYDAAAVPVAHAQAGAQSLSCVVRIHSLVRCTADVCRLEHI